MSADASGAVRNRLSAVAMKRSTFAVFVLSAALLAAGAAFAQTPSQDACGALGVADGAPSLVTTPGYTVLAAIPPLAPPPGAGNFSAILCDRSSIFISPNDHRVLTDLHVPLYIRNAGRVAALELVDGQLRVRFQTGTPTPEEREALATALDRATDALAAQQRAAPQQ